MLTFFTFKDDDGMKSVVLGTGEHLQRFTIPRAAPPKPPRNLDDSALLGSYTGVDAAAGEDADSTDLSNGLEPSQDKTSNPDLSTISNPELGKASSPDPASNPDLSKASDPDPSKADSKASGPDRSKADLSKASDPDPSKVLSPHLSKASNPGLNKASSNPDLSGVPNPGALNPDQTLNSEPNIASNSDLTKALKPDSEPMAGAVDNTVAVAPEQVAGETVVEKPEVFVPTAKEAVGKAGESEGAKVTEGVSMQRGMAAQGTKQTSAGQSVKSESAMDTTHKAAAAEEGAKVIEASTKVKTSTSSDVSGDVMHQNKGQKVTGNSREVKSNGGDVMHQNKEGQKVAANTQEANGVDSSAMNRRGISETSPQAAEKPTVTTEESGVDAYGREINGSGRGDILFDMAKSFGKL